MSFKELLERFPSNGLDNLGEKLRFEYLDSSDEYDQFLTDEDIASVADDLIAKIAKTDFEKHKVDRIHPFLNCASILSQKLGFDEITVCPYVYYESEPIESNYIYVDLPERGESRHLTIDVYDVVEKETGEIRNNIVQELANFTRDAKWAIDGGL